MFKVDSKEFKALVQQLTGQDTYTSSSEFTNEMITVDDILDDEFSNTISAIKFPMDYSIGKSLEENTKDGISHQISLYNEIFSR